MNWWLPEIALSLALLGVATFFSLSAMSLLSVSRAQLKGKAATGDKRASRTIRLLEREELLIATATVCSLVGVVLASLLIYDFLKEWIVGLLLSWNLPEAWSALLSYLLFAIAIAGFLAIVVVLIPRYVVRQHAESVAHATVPIVAGMATIFLLPIQLVVLLSRLGSLLLGVKSYVGISETGQNSEIVSEAEEARINDSSRKLIAGVFEFVDTTVRQAMTPRTEIVGLDLRLSHAAILRKITEEGYSRYPVYSGDLDHIKGVVHTRDVINVLVLSELVILEDLVRPAMFVPDSKLLSEVLADFQRTQNHLAIVLDEFGGTAGLITMEDILEEIVGEIRDEHDVETEPFVMLSDRVCQVAASYSLEDFQKNFSVRLEEVNSSDTVAGYVVNSLGRVPTQGERVTIGDLVFTVVRVRGPRLEVLRVRKQPKPSGQDKLT